MLVLDALSIRDNSIKSNRNIQARLILNSARELAEEIGSLLERYPHNERLLRALGVGRKEMTAYLCERLQQPGGALLCEDTGLRILGLLHVVPEIWARTPPGTGFWKVDHLIVALDAPVESVEMLVDYTLTFLDGPVDFLSAHVPASDGAAVQGLSNSGFRVVGGEAVGVIHSYEPVVSKLPGVSITPLSPPQLDAALEIVSDCDHWNPYAFDSCIGSDRVVALHRDLLTRCLNESNFGSLVAVNDRREILGFAVYRRDFEFENSTERRIASLESICIRPDTQGEELSEMLGRNALTTLKKESVDAVTTRAPMYGSGPTPELSLLRKLGFEIVTSNLIMHRWLT